MKTDEKERMTKLISFHKRKADNLRSEVDRLRLSLEMAGKQISDRDDKIRKLMRQNSDLESRDSKHYWEV